MLKNLTIQNVALIDNLEINFSAKMNVFSGETGAGKSIIIDALNFVIGGKALKSLICQGCEFMKVQALFEGNFSEKVKQILSDYEIECEDELLISRKMSLNGKVDNRINGVVVSSLMVKNISTLLIDIHGQHEHQKILQDKNHLEILDSFLTDKDVKVFSDYREKLSQLREINNQIQKLNGSTQNQERILDLLDYQIKEIEQARLKNGEDEILQEKKLKMQNSEKIFESIDTSIGRLDGSFCVVDQIKDAISILKGICKFDSELDGVVSRLESCKYEISDIVDTLKQKKQEADFDQNEFDTIDERLDKIKMLKKKYGPTLDDVINFLEKSKKDYDDILNSKDKLNEKLLEKEKLLKELYVFASEISDKRRKTAKEFENKVELQLRDLGMKNSKFVVSFEEFPNEENLEKRLKENGCDNVVFMFSANLGQNLKPLSEIISGGEASRFMLALKNILADNDEISSMVFDEIDTGISGEMGFVVACKMANIAKSHQVMAVSHLPQICAMADKNINVKKIIVNDNTKTKIEEIKGEDLLNEIARLSGGLKGNSISLEHSKELKNRCNEYKKSL